MLIFLTLLLAAADPATEWQPVGTSQGVAVWQRRVPDSALVEFRSQMTMALPATQVAAVIWDVSRHREWSANCSQSMLLERKADGTALVYIKVASPFPLADRDVVMAVTTTVTADPNASVTFAFRDTEDSRKPATPGVVRMAKLAASYKVRSVDSTHTEVTYQVIVDPAGNLPTWAVNWGSKDVPVNTLLALQKQAQHGDYQKIAADMQERLHWPQAVANDAP